MCVLTDSKMMTKNPNVRLGDKDVVAGIKLNYDVFKPDDTAPMGKLVSRVKKRKM